MDPFLPHNLDFLSRSKEPLSINLAMFEQPLLKLTLVDILEATNNFCKTNVIGDGGFGTVYKATLPNGKIVEVKKLSEAKTQGEREFIAEMETLGKVKHQNRVPLLGYCSIGEKKLLVYEYMVNGSLDLWLRNRTGAGLCFTLSGKGEFRKLIYSSEVMAVELKRFLAVKTVNLFTRPDKKREFPNTQESLQGEGLLILSNQKGLSLQLHFLAFFGKEFSLWLSFILLIRLLSFLPYYSNE